MDHIARDIRIALRGFRRAPTFTAAVLSILGVGIGTAVAMLTVFRAVLIVHLPVRDPEKIVILTTFKDAAVEFGLVMSDLKEIERSSHTLQGVAGIAHWGATPAPMLDGERSVTLNRVIASGNFFEVLDSRPWLGRFLRRSDALPGADHAMVLSYKAWRRAFGGDSTVVGRSVVEPYSQTRYTIIGVAPPGLEYPAGAEFWIPPGPGSDGISIIAIGRLASGATQSAARSEFASIMQRVSPEKHLAGAKAVAFTQAVLGDVRPILIMLSAAVALLLLIACVNVGNLLLLRAASRTQEVALRRAIGARYADIVRQLLLESGLLAVGGGALGLVWAVALLRILVLSAPAQLPRTDVIELSGAPVVVAIIVTLVAVLLFGVMPTLMSAQTDDSTTLRLDSRSGQGLSGRRRVRQLLVASQMALALMMLAGGILLARSLARLEDLNLGYNVDHLSLLNVSWPLLKEAPGPKLYPLGEELIQRWRAIPGVVAVSPTLFQPLLGTNIFVGRLDLEGQSSVERAANPNIPVETGGEAYFRTFGIPLVRGRGFVDTDREDAAPVAVVSEAVARREWPGEDPVGKRIHFWESDSTAWRTVIGVAGDVHLRTLREATPEIYIPWRQADFWQNSFAVRTSGSLGAVLPAIRRELRAVDPELDLWYAQPMSTLLDAPLAEPRTSAVVMSAFSLAALLLAALGLYGLTASVVRERTREIGIRMALGATPRGVQREVLVRAMVPCSAGAAVGLAGALGMSRLLTSQLFEVSPGDPVALVGACALLLAVAMIAAYLPAHRATKIDPARALRNE